MRSDFFTPLDGKAKRKRFLVLDIESKDGDTQRAGFTRPFQVGVYDGEEYYCFFDQPNTEGWSWEERYWRPGGCVDRAMRFILRREYRGRHIYAHNAGRFDYLFLLPWLMMVGRECGFSFNLIPVASSIQVLDVWSGGMEEQKWQRWRFLDSFKLMPMRLDTAAKTFGLSGKLETNLNTPETDRRSWIDYNRVDCVQLYEVLVKFHHYIENVLCGEIGMTAPSTAMKLFRRNYLKKSMPRNIECHDFVRGGYFGGRVEVYKKRGEGLYYFDLNSSYPAAMLKNMPGGVATPWDGEPPERFLRSRLGFCDVDVYVPDLHIPPLPVRATGRDGTPKGKLIFPRGKLRGVWEWGELQHAIKQGCEITKWHESVWFEPVPMFADFVNDLYAYRDKSNPKYDEGLASVVKIMLNSTYGKFGMKTIRKKIFLAEDAPDGSTPADGTPDSLVWYHEEETDAAYIMPQIAARVTALARVRLHEAMLSAIEAGGEMYYTDTDSIITDVHVPTSTELGALKDEIPEYGGQLTGEFFGPKLYILEKPDGSKPLVKAKGMQDRSVENVRKVASGETIYQERLEKVGSLARANFTRGPKMMTVPRTMRPEASKRIIHEDGTTSPYEVDMWKD